MFSSPPEVTPRNFSFSTTLPYQNMIEILQYLLVYLTLGSVFMLVVERVQPHLPVQDRLTNRDKIVVMLLLPISVIIFIVGFVRGKDKH